MHRLLGSGIALLGGAVFLASAAALLFVVLTASVADAAGLAASNLGVAFPLVLAALFLLATALTWARALRTAEGDDLLSGDRGLLLAAMVVITVVIATGTLLMMVEPDAWRGVMSGISDGAAAARR